MLHLDTSVLVDALTGPRRAAGALRQAIEAGERIQFSTIVLYEWLRGPRLRIELADQEALFPQETAVHFGPAEAVRAAKLSRFVKRPRGREIDVAIAACAIAHRARLWTLNVEDFADVPDLELYQAIT